MQTKFHASFKHTLIDVPINGTKAVQFDYSFYIVIFLL